MSPLAIRTTAILSGLLALAARPLEAFWVQPLTWRIQPSWLGSLANLISLALTVIVPMLLFVLLSAHRPRRPAALRLDTAGVRFVVPVAQHRQGMLAIVALWFAGGLLLFERVPNGDRMRVAQFPETWVVFIASTTLALAATAILLFRSRPAVSLRPAGLTIDGFRRRKEISWDNLAPGGPPSPPTPRALNLKLYRLDPAGTPRFVAEDVPVGLLEVDPRFLAAAIRHYVEQPERRAAIGTESEFVRLQSAVST